jgi:hypothetical protein
MAYAYDETSFDKAKRYLLIHFEEYPELELDLLADKVIDDIIKKHIVEIRNELQELCDELPVEDDDNYDPAETDEDLENYPE